MAETHRASLPVSSRRPIPARKPRPPHRPGYSVQLRPAADETEDLRPPAPALESPAGPLAPSPAKKERPAEERHSGRQRLRAAPRLQARSPGEWVLMAALLIGLAMNAGALLTNAAPSRSDLLLGGPVFLVGIALLVLMEICRRPGSSSH